ncbi:MAG: TetR family transcriptional regulator [Alphaproteobacteria bacterium]
MKSLIFFVMTNERARFAEACLALAAQKEWQGVTLFDIAAQAGGAAADFYPLTPADAFEAIDDYFDRKAAEGAAAPEASALARDRVFDAAMRRFEAMEEERAGVLALDKAMERDPIARAASFARAGKSARWLLALAAENADPARVQALALVLIQTRAAWRGDDAGDFAKTMAALDKGLRRAESFFDSVGRVFKPGPGRARSPEAPPADEDTPADRRAH